MTRIEEFAHLAVSESSLADSVNTFVEFSGPAVFVLILVLILRGDIVTKDQLKAQQAELERWRSIAMDAINLGQAALQRGTTDSHTDDRDSG